MRIETERLLLREPRLEDAKDMFDNWASDPEVTKYLMWLPHKNIIDTKNILNIWLGEEGKPGVHRFLICLKSDGIAQGSIDVVDYDENGVPSIGYCISRKLWNQGYMSEVTEAFINYLYSKGYRKMRIAADVRNIASNRVIQKCGFKFSHIEEREHCSSVRPEAVTINWYILEK